MADLIAKTALDGVAALTLAGTILAEVDAGQITSIAPFAGRENAVSAALKKSLGLEFPVPNTCAEKAGVRIVWSGRAQAFLIGAACPDLGGLAAVTDQSGGWVTLSITGLAATDTLARYVPLDLRRMPIGGAARSQLNHMPLCLMRLGAEAFHLMTFRSMARTAWHELELALKTIAARQA